MAVRDNTTKLYVLLATVTDDFFNGEVVEQVQAYGSRVERILPEVIRTDPLQPQRDWLVNRRA